MSRTSIVPASEPSLLQISSPVTPSVARKKRRPPAASSINGVEEPAGLMSLTRNGSDGSAGVAALRIARPLRAAKKRGLGFSADMVLPPGGPEHRRRNRDGAEERDEGEPPTAVPTPAGSEGAR